jgi:CRP/FNR family cyclic AMP-dependent transcriptional regulator
MATHSAIRLLERDPDLGEQLAEEAFAQAREQVLARVLRFPRGPWAPNPDEFDGSASLGLMLADGLLVRQVTVGERTGAELLGPGDVVQPWLRVGPDASVGSDVNWQVAQPVALAVLDRDFSRRVARWPEITAAVARRVMLRVHWLAFHLALCHMRRVDDRLLLALWHFADRWGRVTPRGVELDLPLTHRLLAAVVGAYRPSVTVAVKALSEAGLIEHTSRSRWTLFGQPPDELRQVHEHAGARERRMPTEIARDPDGRVKAGRMAGSIDGCGGG